MANLSTENLFLLEFLVDNLCMDNRCDCTNPGELCVSFKFLDNEPLEVCAGDFTAGRKFGDDTSCKTGKSCLFSLTPLQAQKVLNTFDITVCVFKKMPPGWQPDRTCVGTTQVSILQQFLDLICNTDSNTAAKVLQDCFPLVDANGKQVGKIAVYVRLSCYGKMIITQFQMNMGDKSVLFKDKDGHSLYRYKKAKKGKTTKIEDMTGKVCPAREQMMMNQMSGQGQFQPNMNCPTQPCFSQGFTQNYGGPFQQANINPVMPPCYPEYGGVSFGGTKKTRSARSGGCGRC